MICFKKIFKADMYFFLEDLKITLETIISAFKDRDSCWSREFMM